MKVRLLFVLFYWEKCNLCWACLTWWCPYCLISCWLHFTFTSTHAYIHIVPFLYHIICSGTAHVRGISAPNPLAQEDGCDFSRHVLRLQPPPWVWVCQPVTWQRADSNITVASVTESLRISWWLGELCLWVYTIFCRDFHKKDKIGRSGELTVIVNICVIFIV